MAPSLIKMALKLRQVCGLPPREPALQGMLTSSCWVGCWRTRKYVRPGCWQAPPRRLEHGLAAAHLQHQRAHAVAERPLRRLHHLLPGHGVAPRPPLVLADAAVPAVVLAHLCRGQGTRVCKTC